MGGASLTFFTYCAIISLWWALTTEFFTSRHKEESNV